MLFVRSYLNHFLFVTVCKVHHTKREELSSPSFHYITHFINLYAKEKMLCSTNAMSEMNDVKSEVGLLS